MTEYGTLKPGDKLDETLNWATNWLGTDTIASSSWVVDPTTGLTLSDEAFTTTTTTVWGEVVEPGTYRLTNSIVTTAGRKSSDDIVIYVEDVGVGYLSPSEAEARLWGRYRIEAEIGVGDIEAASNVLDNLAPFVGSRYSTDTTIQTRQFPRSVTLGALGDTENVVPDRVLDWVALCAYRLAIDEGPAVTSEGAGGVSVSYANPKVSQTDKRMAGLLIPYLRRVGVRV